MCGICYHIWLFIDRGSILVLNFINLYSFSYNISQYLLPKATYEQLVDIRTTQHTGLVLCSNQKYSLFIVLCWPVGVSTVHLKPWEMNLFLTLGWKTFKVLWSFISLAEIRLANGAGGWREGRETMTKWSRKEKANISREACTLWSTLLISHILSRRDGEEIFNPPVPVKWALSCYTYKT